MECEKRIQCSFPTIPEAVGVIDRRAPVAHSFLFEIRQIWIRAACEPTLADAEARPFIRSAQLTLSRRLISQ
eukprot:5451759-Pleurochrysis_carterae.AAC.3